MAEVKNFRPLFFYALCSVPSLLPLAPLQAISKKFAARDAIGVVCGGGGLHLALEGLTSSRFEPLAAHLRLQRGQEARQ